MSFLTLGQRVVASSPVSMEIAEVAALRCYLGRSSALAADIQSPHITPYMHAHALQRDRTSVVQSDVHSVPAPGAANAIMTMPRYVNVLRQDEGEAAAGEAGGGSCGAAGPSPASSAEAEVAQGSVSVVTKQLSGKGSDNLWQLMTAHEAGCCQLWDISSGQLQPVAVLGSQTHPAK